MGKHSVLASLTWIGDLRFAAESGEAHLTLDSDGLAGPSPVQALALALGACMGVDVVHILSKGRHPITGVQVSLDGERADDAPRRLLRVSIHFRIAGLVPLDVVERAVRLSRDTYCSVWHSMRRDIELVTTSEVVA